MELAIQRGAAKRTIVRSAVKVPVAMLVFAAVVIAPAGTLRYWQAWLFLSVIFACSLSTVLWLIVHDPELLERRFNTREKEPNQRRLMRFSWLIAIVAFGTPGLDFRFGWSHIPPLLVVGADAVIIGAYAGFLAILRVNRWASRIIEVASDQRVITTGPYAVVRHPMYGVSILIYVCAPVALGSWWGLLATLPLVWLIVRRIGYEEETLRRELPGYGEYTARVKYRLIPGVW